MHPAETLMDALARGFTREIEARLADGAVIDDPREGRVAGAEPLRRWLQGAHEWLAALSARAELIRATVVDRDAAVETLLHVRVDGEARELPIAVAATADHRDLLLSVRLYHSFWPLERVHRIRGRVLPARPGLRLRSPVDDYQRALAAGDVDGVLACYGRGATAREPAGDPWVHRGPRGLRRFYGALFSHGGGIVLEPGHLVDDGVACALEYTAVRWGEGFTPQAGLAVYERGQNGLLVATRLYDDIDPPRG
jgi:hypothetical protein